MSLYYQLTPVHRECPECFNGRVAPEWSLCKVCDGTGRVFVDGGPLFGCKMILASRKVGEVVTLGNGDRGRVVSHCKRGTPTTNVALIDDLFEAESEIPTSYPSATGVISTLPANARNEDIAGQARSRHDQLDPLQRETRPM